MNKEHGIYIHIPFCRKACSYCDFYFSTQTKHIAEICKGIRREIDLRTQEWKNKKILSIYFGGGTPGMLPLEELELFFEKFNAYGWLSKAKEITLEVNPENVSIENVIAWNKLGINRISLGIQALNENDLHWMQRTHTAEQVITSVQILKEFFYGILNTDLIFGTPHKSIRHINEELEFMVNQNIPHISCYQLTVEDKTLLKKEIERKNLSLPSEEFISEQFIYIHEFLTSMGYEHYEISNYAKPGFRALHNGLYWKGNSYSGFGPSAHSYDGVNKRWKNIANNHEYLRRLHLNMTWFEEEILNENNRWNDYVLTRLRTSDGIDFDEIKNLFSSNQLENIIRKLKNMPSEWFIWKETSVSLTSNGMLFADLISEKLFE